MINTEVKNTAAALYTATKAYAVTQNQELQAVQVVIRPGQSDQMSVSIVVQYKPNSSGEQDTETTVFNTGV